METSSTIPAKPSFQYPNYSAQSSSPMSSPTDSTRRFSQYKPRTSSSSASSSFRQRGQGLPSGTGSGFTFSIAEPPQKLLWKERVRQQVQQRAKKDRQRAHERGRSEDLSSEASSDADAEMENEDALDDELYRRIMIEERKRAAYQARLTYEREFGSSDDIYLQDLEELENEFSSHAGENSATGPSQDELARMAVEDPEAMYEAYLPDIGHNEDEFEEEFEDIDPKTLAELME